MGVGGMGVVIWVVIIWVGIIWVVGGCVLWAWKMVKNGGFWGYFEIRNLGLVWAFYDFSGFYTVTPFINHNMGRFLGFVGVF